MKTQKELLDLIEEKSENLEVRQKEEMKILEKKQQEIQWKIQDLKNELDELNSKECDLYDTHKKEEIVILDNFNVCSRYYIRELLKYDSCYEKEITLALKGKGSIKDINDFKHKNIFHPEHFIQLLNLDQGGAGAEDLDHGNYDDQSKAGAPDQEKKEAKE